MNYIKSCILLIGSLIFLSMKIFSAEIYIHYPEKPQIKKPVPVGFLKFQIMEGEIKIDNTNVKNASMVYNAEGNFQGLKIELILKAAAELEKLTEHSINKTIQIIMNQKIVSTAVLHSAIGPQFLLASINKEDAQSFIQSLQSYKESQKNK